MNLGNKEGYIVLEYFGTLAVVSCKAWDMGLSFKPFCKAHYVEGSIRMY